MEKQNSDRAALTYELPIADGQFGSAIEVVATPQGLEFGDYSLLSWQWIFRALTIVLPSAPQLSQRPEVGSADWFSALRWIKETAGQSLEPYGAITDLGKQEETWKCHGCSGEFLSRWPKWEKPTDKSFAHEAECMYLKASRLLASAENNRSELRQTESE